MAFINSCERQSSALQRSKKCYRYFIIINCNFHFPSIATKEVKHWSLFLKSFWSGNNVSFLLNIFSKFSEITRSMIIGRYFFFRVTYNIEYIGFKSYPINWKRASAYTCQINWKRTSIISFIYSWILRRKKRKKKRSEIN